MNTADRAKAHAIEHLTATIESHRQGDYHSIGIGYDEYDKMVPREGVANDHPLMIALELWASWSDTAGHDWHFYPGLVKDDWPRLAEILVEDLKADRPITDRALLQHFVNQSPKQRQSMLARLKRALHPEKQHNQAL